MINISDYTAPYKVVAANEATTQRLDEVISFAEEKYLRSILGANYSDFVDNPGDWTDFINGTDYIWNGQTINYRGIKEPLKLLIFKDLQDELMVNVTNHGYQKLNYDTGKQIHPAYKICQAWNTAVTRLNTEVSLYLYRIKNIVFQNFDYVNQWI